MNAPSSKRHRLRLSVVLHVPEEAHAQIEALGAGIVFSGPDDGQPIVALRLRGETDVVPIVLGRAAAAALGASLIAAAGVFQTGTQELPIDE